jgi:hypothetical protein
MQQRNRATSTPRPHFKRVYLPRSRANQIYDIKKSIPSLEKKMNVVVTLLLLRCAAEWERHLSLNLSLIQPPTLPTAMQCHRMIITEF